MTKLSVILFWVLVAGCTSLPEDTVNSEVLLSSKGEKIYIKTINWGATNDYQISIITTEKNKLQKRADSIGTVSGIEPFVYTFQNDSLTLYFDRENTYRINEPFRTVQVSYVVLNQKEFKKILIKASENNGYHSVPKAKKKTYPSDIRNL